MAQITVKDFKEIITDPDRVRIISDNKIIWSGWGCDIPEKYKEETVKKFRSVPELRHKKWQELGLMKPFEPDQVAPYKFSDLEMKLYYDIHI